MGELVMPRGVRVCRDCSGQMVDVAHNRRFCDRCRKTRKRQSEQAAQDRWRAANPGKRPVYNRRAALKRKYGMSEVDFDQMLAAQGGVCAIEGCSKVADRVDHCHDTGVVRGLLCHGCNVRLSGLEDLEWRARALRYLGEGVMTIGITKHGQGEILPDPEDSQKTASQNWTPDDQQALAKENADADEDGDC